MSGDYDEQAELESVPQISEDVLDRLKEVTRAELFKDIIHPDLKKSFQIEDERPFSIFTKELKVSNLSDFQLYYTIELTDLALEWIKHGALNAGKKILAFRDTLLSAAPSRNATLLKLMNTEYSIRRLETVSKGKSLFRRGGEEE